MQLQSVMSRLLVRHVSQAVHLNQKLRAILSSGMVQGMNRKLMLIKSAEARDE